MCNFLLHSWEPETIKTVFQPVFKRSPDTYFSYISAMSPRIETGVSGAVLFLLLFHHGFCLEHIELLLAYRSTKLLITALYSAQDSSSVLRNLLQLAHIWVTLEIWEQERERGSSPVEPVCCSPPATNALGSEYQVLSDAENYGSVYFLYASSF